MKIAFFGYDYTLDIVQRLIADGHEVVQIFTFPCDGVFAFNTQIYEFGAHFNIPVSEHKVDSLTIDGLIGQGCGLFLCAGYPHKIPDIDPAKAYGLNLHPSLLPRGRGIMPLPHIIMHEPEAAGFTVHKLVSGFDAGDILYQRAVSIDARDDVETLSARIAVHAPGAVSGVIKNITTLWGKAVPQDSEAASSYGVPDEVMRSLRWDETVEALRLKGRAFGRFGVMATVENNMGQTQKLAVFQFGVWEEAHAHAAGTLLRSSSREIVVAVSDGYACLKEFQVLEG